uniref:Large ribosomal subunit protein bL21c n=1 Tax=Gracilaria tenuistipitata var. liui TaxID=285951 RepID=RK21_GRATL|nr:ribosomal protein L21 [Gracilaria tenuistipitata var. liui]Q6B932.1 RecName: Full=Large ribosomal subunit protein bL21c; AltName: Full=50S ribosomal protein L21, chloroplastic [Gracilaria tenuistipitata var. liui]AAT79603.1 50S ribosomal protein L21 [Gracilaria tenuistipitata var. liui]
MLYAIIEADGKQMWIEPGKYYDVNYIPGEPGDYIQFNKVLVLRQENDIYVGKPCIQSIIIKAKILKHLKSKKITVFKIKPKKNSRKKQGHRQKLTRLLIEEFYNQI